MDGDRVQKPANAVPVAVIEAERIAGLGELFDGNAALEARNAMAPEYVVQPRLDPSPRAFEDTAAGAQAEEPRGRGTGWSNALSKSSAVRSLPRG